MGELAGIRNFLQIDGDLATSGMPRPDDFAAIARAGYQLVVNLAMPTSDNAMPEEGDLVSRAGMSYLHIPVNFESPKAAEFQLFSRVLESMPGQRVFVHCAANMRVSAFVFLHRVLRDGAPRDDAERDLKRIWNPEGAWRQFIDQHLDAAGLPPLS